MGSSCLVVSCCLVLVPSTYRQKTRHCWKWFSCSLLVCLPSPSPFLKKQKINIVEGHAKQNRTHPAVVAAVVVVGWWWWVVLLLLLVAAVGCHLLPVVTVVTSCYRLLPVVRASLPVGQLLTRVAVPVVVVALAEAVAVAVGGGE